MTHKNITDIDVKDIQREAPEKLEKWEIISKLIPYRGLVLDVGCYDNSFSRRLRMYSCMHGLSYVGVNMNVDAIKDAKNKKLDVVLASTDFLPFHSESFDTCTLLHVAEHIYYPGKAIVEAYRILKSDGRLVLTARNFANFVDRIHMMVGKDIIPGLEESELIRFFTWKSLSILLRKNGFKLEERKNWYVPFPTRGVTNRFSKWRRLMRFSASVMPNLDESLIGSWRKISQ